MFLILYENSEIVTIGIWKDIWHLLAPNPHQLDSFLTEAKTTHSVPGESAFRSQHQERTESWQLALCSHEYRPAVTATTSHNAALIYVVRLLAFCWVTAKKSNHEVPSYCRVGSRDHESEQAMFNMRAVNDDKYPDISYRMSSLLRFLGPSDAAETAVPTSPNEAASQWSKVQ
jgi:hypothetical protein